MTIEIQEFQQIKGMSPVTAQLIQLLKDGKPGDTKADNEFPATLQIGVKGKHYPNLLTAIRYLEREHGVVWQRVRKAKILKCLDAQERIGVGAQNIKHIRKTATRTVRVIASADFSTLTDSERTKANTQLAQLGAIKLFAENPTHAALAHGQNQGRLV